MFITPGFHHIAMVSGDAPRTLAFYRGVLGIGLVKRTVNFDDPTSYHLYFGDAVGAPGTILTFFASPGGRRRYPPSGARRRHAGGTAQVEAAAHGLRRRRQRPARPRPLPQHLLRRPRRATYCSKSRPTVPAS